MTVTLSGFTQEPCCRGSFRQKNQSYSQLPYGVSCCKDKCPMTVAVSKVFQNKYTLCGLKDDKCWGHKGCYSQILFPTFLTLSYSFKFEHAGSDKTKIILQFVLQFQLSQYSTAQTACQNSPKPRLPSPQRCCSKCQCSCPFVHDKGYDTCKKQFPNFNNNFYPNLILSISLIKTQAEKMSA